MDIATAVKSANGVGSQPRPALMLETKTNKVKSKMLQAIKDDSLAEVESLMISEGILPNEELSRFGCLWNSLHCNIGREGTLSKLTFDCLGMN